MCERRDWTRESACAVGRRSVDVRLVMMCKSKQSEGSEQEPKIEWKPIEEASKIEPEGKPAVAYCVVLSYSAMSCVRADLLK